MGKQTGCYADSIAANPNRPTVANPADITQYGVLELEYGWDRQWPEEGRQQASVGGLLKFGCFATLSCVGIRPRSCRRLTREVQTGVSETTGLVRRSAFTGRRNEYQHSPSAMPSKYLPPARKMV